MNIIETLPPAANSSLDLSLRTTGVSALTTSSDEFANKVSQFSRDWPNDFAEWMYRA